MQNIIRKFGLWLTMLGVTMCAVVALAGCGQSASTATSVVIEPTVSAVPSVVEPMTEEPTEVEPTAASIAWTTAMECTTCHTTQAESLTNGSMMAAHADLACIDCHTDEEALTNVHANVMTTESSPELTALKVTTVSESICLGCHGDWASLSEKTANLTVLTDTNGTTVNPHTITTLMNENGQHDNTTCMSCHSMHSQISADEAAPNYCLGCHHQGVYECGTCHAAGE